MAKILQVGVGSGGMPVLDAVARDQRIDLVTLFDPDVYQDHNVERHVFGHHQVGRNKVDMAKEWLCQRRPDLGRDARRERRTHSPARRRCPAALRQPDA